MWEHQFLASFHTNLSLSPGPKTHFTSSDMIGLLLLLGRRQDGLQEVTFSLGRDHNLATSH